jgi:hypothetical protein
MFPLAASKEPRSPLFPSAAITAPLFSSFPMYQTVRTQQSAHRRTLEWSGSAKHSLLGLISGVWSWFALGMGSPVCQGRPRQLPIIIRFTPLHLLGHREFQTRIQVDEMTMMTEGGVAAVAAVAAAVS